MRNVAIVLAGGSGSRMHSDTPKQYMELAGKPLLYHSLKVFQDAALIDGIILVAGEGQEAYCHELFVRQYAMDKILAVVTGGRERYDSVYNGLSVTPPCGYVLIHDGARPCVTADILRRTLEDAALYGASVAAVPVKDTIRVADAAGNVVETPARDTLWSIQTPQTFSYDLIMDAYRKFQQQRGTFPVPVTDDAMVVERMTGQSVHLTMGAYENLKVTTQEDLPAAAIFLEKSH